jgi:hypothetical protein
MFRTYSVLWGAIQVNAGQARCQQLANHDASVKQRSPGVTRSFRITSLNSAGYQLCTAVPGCYESAHTGVYAAPVLPGTLPGAAWRNLTRLMSLAVGNNSLTGTLPPELAATSPRLQALILGMNRFTGAS